MLTAALGLAVLLVVAGLTTVVLVRGGAGPLERAVELVPAESQRVVFTDWEQVRELTDAELPDGSGSEREAGELQAFLDEAYDADLTRLSALEDHAVDLAVIFDLVVPEADWEVFAQSESGAVAVLSLPDADLAALRDTLERLGYVREGDLFSNSVDEVARISPSLTPIELNVVVLEDDGLVVLSDLPDYATLTAGVIAGEEDSVADVVDPLLGRLESEPRAAILWTRDHACAAIGLGGSDPEDQTVAEQLVADAGGVDPVSGVLLAATGPTVTAVLGFTDDDQARSNLQPRTDLAAGDAPGLGGTFAERFEIGAAEQQGSQVVLELEPVLDGVFSTLAAGPLLFASC